MMFTRAAGPSTDQRSATPVSESLAPRLRELVQHAAIYGLGPVLGQVAAFLLLPLYTNLLSPADYGTLEIILLVGTFLNIFFGLQTVTQLLRFYHACERERDRRLVVSTSIIFTGVVTAAAILPADLLRDRIALALFGTDAHAPLLHLAFWSMVSSNVFATALGYLQARKMSRAFTILSVAQLVCTLSLNLFFVAWLRRGVEGILLSQFLVTGAFAVGLTAWVFTQTGVAVSLSRVREMLAFGLPLIGWSLVVFAVNAADRVVLSGVGSLTDVGVYSLANRFGMALLVFVVTPFSRFWAAERFAVAKQPGGKAVIARIFTYFFAVLCFAALAVSVWVGELVRLMAAEQFWAAAQIGPVLVLAYVLWGAFDALMAGVLIEGRTKAVGVLTGTAAALHVGLCVGLGRVLLAAGVAWAKVITLAVLTVGVYVIAQRRYPIAYELGRVAKVLGIAVTLFVASTFLEGLPPLLAVALNTPLVLAFPVVLVAVGFLEPGEKHWLRARASGLIGRLQVAASEAGGRSQ
jgi:O-antigen/teichoic acid export membrane protein